MLRHEILSRYASIVEDITITRAIQHVTSPDTTLAATGEAASDAVTGDKQ